MNIYIANFDIEFQNEDLKNLFIPHGDVASAEIAMDGFTERSRGFGYVEMPNEQQAQAAITALHQSTLGGRTLTVQQAVPKETHRGSYKVGTGMIFAKSSFKRTNHR